MATLGQQVYEKVERLKSQGVKGGDAFRKVAEEHGKTLSAVRGNYYSHARKLTGSGVRAAGRGRRAAASAGGEVSIESAVRSAREILERALAGIDGEVGRAKQRLDRAQAEYDEVVSKISDRKKELSKKIASLSS